MRIAIDFDNTLATWDPERPNEIGPAIMRNLSLALRLQQAGHKLILWTCREGKSLEQAAKWCAQHGLIFDAVNANIHDPGYGWPDSRKVYADLYIDDRAVNAQAAEIICGLL